MAVRNEPTSTPGTGEQEFSRRTLLVRGLAAAVGAALFPSSPLNTCFGGPDSPSRELKAASDEWQRKRTSSSLNERFEALSQVVRTKKLEAFEILVGEFLAKDSQKHQDKLLELIAPVAAESFGGKEFDTEWEKLFASKEFLSTNLNNCWLVYSVSKQRIFDFRKDDVLAFTLKAEVPTLFTIAALRAFSAITFAPDSFSSALLGKIPAAPEELRGLFLEAVADVLYANIKFNPPDQVQNKATPAAVRELISYLDETKVPRRTIRKVGEIIAKLVGSKNIFKNSDGWLAYLDGRKTAESLRAEGYAVPEEQTQYFFGAKGTGLKFCYVIDMSGSMTDPIVLTSAAPSNPSSPPKRNGPISGKDGDAAHDAKEPPAPASTPTPGIEDLPLNKIKTRLDAAKEALKASLRKLPPEASFSIAVFGDDAKVIVDEKNMLTATPRNIEAAIAAIDKLAVMGRTNLHRGLELAFEIAGKGVKIPGSPPSPSLYDGPDVVFVLSDGVPNRDSYTARIGLGVPYLFEQHENLARSIQRMNLFYRSTLNFVTVGVSDAELFSYIAEKTGGTLLQYGK